MITGARVVTTPEGMFLMTPADAAVVVDTPITGVLVAEEKTLILLQIGRIIGQLPLNDGDLASLRQAPQVMVVEMDEQAMKANHTLRMRVATLR